MILFSAAVVVPRRLPLKAVSMATNINTEQIRTKLDQLHSEAEKTRAKANNARLRLLRLSEAAEKLRRQAAINVQTGKENDARELLCQKKKVMQALEKSKSRIELLDELSTKLNENRNLGFNSLLDKQSNIPLANSNLGFGSLLEKLEKNFAELKVLAYFMIRSHMWFQAISVKETQLIGNVALDLEVGREDASTPVRIISPKEDTADYSNEKEDFFQISMKLDEDQEQQFQTEFQENLPINHQHEDIEEGNVTTGIWNEDDMISNLNGISSYEDFLKHLDQQLNKIEVELVTVLRLSNLVLESKEKPKNSKVQQTKEILQSVRGIRGSLPAIILMSGGEEEPDGRMRGMEKNSTVAALNAKGHYQICLGIAASNSHFGRLNGTTAVKCKYQFEDACTQAIISR
ncbi:hypothetical protein HHK36_005031 [Tetracentron sinense]|uniref:Uncharacterized protein n=1 Tax=Tetracentron sinense TaxID=13715 RepID=A0A835DMF9_TETSI|nr:hypothetical protein HHK36_005031 [Tetracentron sinense]